MTEAKPVSQMCSSDGDNFDWESRHFHIEHFNERGVRKIPIRCKDYNAIPARWQFDPLRRTGNVNLARMVHNPTSSLFFSCLKTFPWQRAKKSKRLTCGQHVRGVPILHSCVVCSCLAALARYGLNATRWGHLRHGARHFTDAPLAKVEKKDDISIPSCIN